MLRFELKKLFYRKQLLLHPVLFGMIFPLIYVVTQTKTTFELTQTITVFSFAFFFVAQTILEKSFEDDLEDGFLNQLRLQKNMADKIFFAKLIRYYIHLLMCVVPVAFWVFLLLGQNLELNWPALLLACLGLVTVGITLSYIFKQASSRASLVYSFLFFTMLSPVILMFSQAHIDTENLNRWLLMLSCFDLIYLAVGWLVFNDVF